MDYVCKCGCGISFTPSKASLYRMKKGLDSGYIFEHRNRRERNPNWKGGRFTSSDGYIYILMPEHPNALRKGYVGYVAEHRLVMSNSIGRPLRRDEIVHHKNEIKSDNSLDNLEIMDRATHAKEHTCGENNGNWKGGRPKLVCHTCDNSFTPADRKNDYGAIYCSRQCYYNRNKRK